MRPFLPGTGTVDCNRPLDISILQREPETVAFADIALAELGKLARHLALERETKSDEFAVIARMKLDDSSYGAGYVAFVNRKSHDEIRGA